VAIGLRPRRPPPAPDERNFFDQQVRAFRACFARCPDLALEVLCYARQRLARYTNTPDATNAARVRAFLLNNPGSAARLKDGEIAARVFGREGRDEGKGSSAVETVKHARQSLSWKVEKIPRSRQELARLRREIRKELREQGLPKEWEGTIFKQAQRRCVFVWPKGKNSR
jgi:hypothetical protein